MRSLASLLVIGCFIYLKFYTDTEKPLAQVKSFQLPIIENSKYPESIKSSKHYQYEISRTFPRFAGKFKFSDSIDISTYQKDIDFEQNYVSTPEGIPSYDSPEVNGFDIFVDYNQNIPFPSHNNTSIIVGRYFPVYIVNNGTTDKLFLGKDGYAFGIQEAKSRYDRWHPVEMKGLDFCGLGYWGLTVKPSEFVVLLMPKYEGDYNTEMRVRLRIDQNIYVSKPFLGSIHEDQFSLDKGSLNETRVQSNKSHYAFNKLFYGAIPIWTR